MKTRRHKQKVCPKQQENYPCGICNENCPTDSVKCIKCELWFHISCANITPDQLNAMSLLNEEYLCVTCTHVDNKYDFCNAMRRLSSSAESGKLPCTAEMEMILLRNTPLQQDEDEKNGCYMDSIAFEMLQKSGMYIL